MNPVTLTVQSSLFPSLPGQAVTFTAFVEPISGMSDPSGTVQISDGLTDLGTFPLMLGQASTTTVFNEAGARSIYATYSGDTNYCGNLVRFGQQVADIRKVTIWGNHSSTQYPDIHHATVKGNAALSLVDQAWYKDSFIPTVQQRGAAVIKARGASSAASAASAAIDHMRTWAHGTAEGDWASMAIPSDGSYGIKPGVMYGYPVSVKNGKYAIVPDLEINAFSRERMDATDKELREERASVEHLFAKR